MAKRKNPEKNYVIAILTSYNNFFEKIFENHIFSTSDQKIIQKIYQKLSEISALIGGIEGDK